MEEIPKVNGLDAEEPGTREVTAETRFAKLKRFCRRPCGMNNLQLMLMLGLVGLLAASRTQVQPVLMLANNGNPLPVAVVSEDTAELMRLRRQAAAAYREAVQKGTADCVPCEERRKQLAAESLRVARLNKLGKPAPLPMEESELPPVELPHLREPAEILNRPEPPIGPASGTAVRSGSAGTE